MIWHAKKCFGSSLVMFWSHSIDIYSRNDRGEQSNHLPIDLSVPFVLIFMTWVIADWKIPLHSKCHSNLVQDSYEFYSYTKPFEQVQYWNSVLNRVNDFQPTLKPAHYN